MQDKQLCVLYNRLCQHLPKPAFAQAKQHIQKEEKDFFHPPRGNKSTSFTPQTCAMFPHASDGWQKRCGVVGIFQPSTGEKKRLLKERHLLQNAFMHGFACKFNPQPGCESLVVTKRRNSSRKHLCPPAITRAKIPYQKLFESKKTLHKTRRPGDMCSHAETLATATSDQIVRKRGKKIFCLKAASA